jgi:hypothetical protein
MGFEGKILDHFMERGLNELCESGTYSRRYSGRCPGMRNDEMMVDGCIERSTGALLGFKYHFREHQLLSLA